MFAIQLQYKHAHKQVPGNFNLYRKFFKKFRLIVISVLIMACACAMGSSGESSGTDND